MHAKLSGRAALAGLMVLGAATAATAAPTGAAVDLGPAANTADGNHVAFTVALKLRNTAAAEATLASLYTPGSPQFHQFLRSGDFKAQFAPTADTVARVMQHFRSAGFSVTQTTSTQLVVSGNANQVEAEFGVPLHEYEVPATADHAAARFHAPAGSPTLPTAIADAVQGVVGLDSRPRYRPHVIRSGARTALASLKSVTSPQSSGTTNPPGLLTVQDFAQYYDVNPLYARGLSGRGSTIGIVTLASFTPSDAFTYWNSLGLKVSPKRITEIQVDGGSGPPSDKSGSDETTLDVEQSGGIAPGANIAVYEAPNTSQGFIDAFAAAIDANQADTISVSWGEWEFFDTLAVGGPVVDPVTGRNVSSLQAFDDLFLQAALQGQSMYAAAGDSGAYDEVRDLGVPAYPPPAGSQVLSVDDPAAQRWMTAMGGTTLPGTQTFNNGFSVNIAAEQAWGWDYLIPLCTQLGFDPVSCGIYSVGGGGGVSSFVPRPFYQEGIRGIQNTASGQTLLDFTQSPPALITTLPAGFHGRNVPDLSLNSDPETGYVIYYTSSVTGPGVATFFGGTSFAAPQFNGVTALFDQALHGRVGLMNFALYRLARSGDAYEGRNAPLRDITAGDNWGYSAHQGYDQATGLGVPDVAHLLRALADEYGDQGDQGNQNGQD